MPSIKSGPEKGKFIPLPRQFRSWKSRTSAVGKPRSKELKALDLAISDDFRQQDAGGNFLAERDVQSSLLAWQATKEVNDNDNDNDSAWKKSRRNKSGIISDLQTFLNSMGSMGLPQTAAETKAFRFIEIEQQRAIQKLFRKKTLQFRRDSAGGFLNRYEGAQEKLVAVAKHHKELTVMKAKTAYSVGKAVKLVKEGWEIGQKPSPSSDGFGFLEHLPIVSMALAGFNTTVDLYKVTKAIARTKPMIKKSIPDFRKGDPQQAVKAVLRLLNAEIKANGRSAVINFSDLVTRSILTATGVAAVSAPAVGLVKSFVAAAATSYFYVQAKKEIEAANKITCGGCITIKAFETSPVLGAYYVCTQDTSTLIDLSIRELGRPGFMGDAEEIARQIQPVIQKSGELIRGSKIYIKDLKNNKNVIKAAYSKRF